MPNAYYGSTASRLIETDQTAAASEVSCMGTPALQLGYRLKKLIVRKQYEQKQLVAGQHAEREGEERK